MFPCAVTSEISGLYEFLDLGYFCLSVILLVRVKNLSLTFSFLMCVV